jgi:hypothetical protein
MIALQPHTPTLLADHYGRFVNNDGVDAQIDEEMPA